MYVILINSYPKLGEDGKIKLNSKNEPIIVFRYRWHGTPEELEAFKASNDKNTINNVTDDKGTLWFSPVYVGDKTTIHISKNGKVYADTTLLDAAKSLMQQHGELGKLLALDLLKSGFSNREASDKIAEPVTPEITD